MLFVKSISFLALVLTEIIKKNYGGMLFSNFRLLLYVLTLNNFAAGL